MKEDNIDFLIEWAVWGNLDKSKDLELILLKGHLLIETVLGMVLQRSGADKIDNYSFHQRINELEKLEFNKNGKRSLILSSLRKINKLRNKLAHDFYFKISDGELELWSKNILDNLEGTKYSKFTYRTKIVHAFSILSINILELKII